MSGGPLVAVVTGGNKGIGFAIVRGLCKQFKGDVYLTARDATRGQQAVKDLNKEGLNPKFFQLDLTEKDTIKKLQSHLEENYGGLDILVNNAGIAYKQASTAPFSEQAEVTMATNFTGTLDVCDILFPLLRPHARVVNVSSMSSQSALSKCGEHLKKKFVNRDISREELKELMQQFVDATKAKNHSEKGWPNSAYGTTKIGVTVMSVIQQREFDVDSREDLVVNAVGIMNIIQEKETGQTYYGCCPGYVNTDMSSHKGRKTIDEGADTPLYLAMLPPNITSPKGKFVSDRKIGKWE